MYSIVSTVYACTCGVSQKSAKELDFFLSYFFAYDNELYTTMTKKRKACSPPSEDNTTKKQNFVEMDSYLNESASHRAFVNFLIHGPKPTAEVEKRKACSPSSEDNTTKKRMSSENKKGERSKGEIDVVSDALFGNADIASMIFSCLEAKELLRFVSCSKSYLSRLTYKDVVRSAVLTGGRAKTSMGRIVPLIKNRDIFIPSQIRLLRLMCGKRCERCNVRTVNYVSDSYGVFFCFDWCLQKCTKKVGHNKKWSPYLDQPRVAQGRFSKGSYVMKGHYRDNSGERCGPLVTLGLIEKIMKEKPVSVSEAVSSWVKPFDDRQKNAEGNAREILDTFQETKEAGEQRELERYEKKALAKKNFREAKHKRIDQLMNDLAGLIGDDESWKCHLIDRVWISSKNKFHFTNYIVRHVLMDAQKAPSQVTKKKLKEISNELSALFTWEAKAKILMDRFKKVVGPDLWESHFGEDAITCNAISNLYRFGYDDRVRTLSNKLFTSPNILGNDITDEILEEYAKELREMLSSRKDTNTKKSPISSRFVFKRKDRMTKS